MRVWHACASRTSQGQAQVPRWTQAAWSWDVCAKTPCRSAQVKYRTPKRLPSCVPISSSISTPIHSLRAVAPSTTHSGTQQYTNYSIDLCLLHINKRLLFGTSNLFFTATWYGTVVDHQASPTPTLVSPMYRTVPPCPRNSTRWFKLNAPSGATAGAAAIGGASGTSAAVTVVAGASDTADAADTAAVEATLATFGGGVNAANTARPCLGIAKFAAKPETFAIFSFKPGYKNKSA